MSSSADFENLFALTVNFLVNSPLPKTLTPLFVAGTNPFSTNNSGVTTVPSSNLFKSLTLTIA